MTIRIGLLSIRIEYGYRWVYDTDRKTMVPSQITLKALKKRITKAISPCWENKIQAIKLFRAIALEETGKNISLYDAKIYVEEWGVYNRKEGEV